MFLRQKMRRISLLVFFGCLTLIQARPEAGYSYSQQQQPLQFIQSQQNTLNQQGLPQVAQYQYQPSLSQAAQFQAQAPKQVILGPAQQQSLPALHTVPITAISQAGTDYSQNLQPQQVNLVPQVNLIQNQHSLSQIVEQLPPQQPQSVSYQQVVEPSRLPETPIIQTPQESFVHISPQPTQVGTNLDIPKSIPQLPLQAQPQIPVQNVQIALSQPTLNQNFGDLPQSHVVPQILTPPQVVSPILPQPQVAPQILPPPQVAPSILSSPQVVQQILPPSEVAPPILSQPQVALPILPQPQVVPQILPQSQITVQQPLPLITKHVYVHVAPDEPPLPPPVIPSPPPPRKNYKIIFIKAPSQSPSQREVINLPASQPLVEEKTLIYVLVDKPQQPKIVVPAPAPTPLSKPEVYFIKYKVNSAVSSASPAGANLEGSLPIVEDVKKAQNQEESISSGESTSSLFSGGLPNSALKYGPPGYQKRNV